MKRSMRNLHSLLLIFGFLAPAIGNEGLARSIGAAANWAAHGADADETNFSQLDQINVANVSRLGPGWWLELPGEVSLEATPLAIDGVLYFTGSYAAVYAVDGVTGKLLWKYDPETWKHNPAKMRFIFAVNRGAAYADGRIFLRPSTAVCSPSMPRPAELLWSVETTAPRRLMELSQVRRVHSTARSSSAMPAPTSARAAM